MLHGGARQGTSKTKNVKKMKSEVQKTLLDSTVACLRFSRVRHSSNHGRSARPLCGREGNGQKTADRKIPSGKSFSEKARFSRGKRAFALAALTKTLENSPVMFWKKSPTREKRRKNRHFSPPPIFSRSEKSCRAGQALALTHQLSIVNRWWVCAKDWPTLSWPLSKETDVHQTILYFEDQ
jgi:hypothetical protein